MSSDARHRGGRGKVKRCGRLRKGVDGDCFESMAAAASRDDNAENA